mgnify:CR=1 FL=1
MRDETAREAHGIHRLDVHASPRIDELGPVHLQIANLKLQSELWKGLERTLMPRLRPNSVKSAIKLLRQSTTVPNTSKTSARTDENSVAERESAAAHELFGRRAADLLIWRLRLTSWSRSQQTAAPLNRP